MLFRDSHFSKLIYSDLHFQLISWFKTPAFLAEGRTKEQTIDIQYASLYWAYIDAKYSNFFNIYVYFFFFLFLIIYIITLPIYLTTLFIKLVQNIFNIWVYKCSQKPDIQLSSKTDYFESHWLGFVYYSTYLRAEVTAFSIVYTTLRLCFGKVNKVNKHNLLPLILKVFLMFIFRLLWSVIFHTPLRAVTRSYRYASVFWEVNSFKQLDTRVVRWRIINNYMIREMGPTLRFRIYRVGNNPWNFNPYVLENSKASIVLFNKTEPYHPYFLDRVEVRNGTYPEESPTNHFEAYVPVGKSGGRVVELRMKVTSGFKNGLPAHSFVHFCNSESRTREQSLILTRLGFSDQFTKSSTSLSIDDNRVVLANWEYYASIKLSHILLQAQLPFYKDTNILNPTNSLYSPDQLEPITEVELYPRLFDKLREVHLIFNDTQGIVGEMGKPGVDEFINLCVQKYSPESLDIVSNIKSSEAYSNYVINPYDIPNNI